MVFKENIFPFKQAVSDQPSTSAMQPDYSDEFEGIPVFTPSIHHDVDSHH